MIWQFQTAKAKLSEVFRAAETEGPQTITVRGKKRFVLMLEGEETARPGKTPTTWEEFYAPVRGLFDDFKFPPREAEPDRKLDLFDTDK